MAHRTDLDSQWTVHRRGRIGAPRRLAAVLTSLLVLSSVPVISESAVRAQTVATAEPAIVVYGVGEASVPAASTTVQVIVGRSRSEFGFSRDGSGGGSFSGGGSVSGSDFVAELEEVIAEATPEGQSMATPDAAGMATPEARGRKDRQGREPRVKRGPVSDEELEPLVAVIAEKAGVSPQDIDVDFSPLATEPYGGREDNARLAFDTSMVTSEEITGLIVAVSDAASAAGLVIEIAGVRYNPADCAALVSEAELAAIADARTQAERLAGNLNVTLGDVIGAQAQPYFSSEPSSACGSEDAFYYESSYGGLGLTVPVFDPSSEGEVEVQSVLSIAFAIAEDSD